MSEKVQVRCTGRPAFVAEIAGGMETDTAGSAGGTLLTIGLLFWLTHRRLRPLAWLLLVLVVILTATTAAGSLVLGSVNVVSIGFASILLGLSEDFGILIYQESRSHPELEATALRQAVAPGICWSALTTAGAFFTLNLSTLPGLRQLGTLVAMGILLSAVVMLYGYLPLVMRLRRPGDLRPATSETEERFLLFSVHRLLPPAWLLALSLILLLSSIAILGNQGLRLNYSPDVFKPKNSEATAAIEQIQARFASQQDPLWVLVPGRDEPEVWRRLTRVESWLRQAQDRRLLASFTLATPLWPRAEHQQANRTAAAALVERRELLRRAALDAGFNTNALLVTDRLLDAWRSALDSTKVFWPTNHSSRWILRKLVARSSEGFLALGLVHPTSRIGDAGTLSKEWPADLKRDGVILTGWDLLGSTVFDTVVAELPVVLLPVVVLVLLTLWLAFRNVKEVLLSLATLAFSGLLLGATMNVLHWDWNLLNLMALPLLLGMGVDFSIHMQLALRRYEGDLLAVRRSVGRALLLAGATTVAGFGSLGFSSNSGMASLGCVCALGITLALLVAVHLLPVWWQVWIKSAQPAARFKGAP